jgi:hypothetical protein
VAQKKKEAREKFATGPKEAEGEDDAIAALSASSVSANGQLGLNLSLGPLGSEVAEQLKAIDGRNGEVAARPTKPEVYEGINFTKPLQLIFLPRSTEGVIYYLGEIVRRQLYPDRLDNRQTRRMVVIKYGREDEPIPDAQCPPSGAPVAINNFYRCEPIFVVDKLPASADPLTFLAVTYDYNRYAVPTETLVNNFPLAGRTTQLMDIVAQLIGMNKSAKNLPTTSVFTLISTP